MSTLEYVEISGYKSIRHMELELGSLNVLIGANGAGKSNCVSFFKLLNEMMGQRLQAFIGAAGGAQSVLHYGPKKTPLLQGLLRFCTDSGDSTYYMRLVHAAVDALMFAEERLEFQRDEHAAPYVVDLGAGHRETQVLEAARDGDATARVFRHLLNNCRVFQFHDTSSTARIRQASYVDANRFFMPDGGNLASVLYKLQNTNEMAYSRIVQTIRQIAPFFDDFVLAPSAVNEKSIFLNWRERDSDLVFGPHMLSDGTLRAMALVTLFLQPREDLPSVIVIDEPELGLHPYAITILACLAKEAAFHSQVILATQSVSLVDEFDVEDVVVVERDRGESTFARIDRERLKEWLEEYSVGELWEKNVIGGGPL